MWLAKFSFRNDKFNYGRGKAATLCMAQDCGIDVPETKVVDEAGQDVFMIRCFDREKTEKGYFRKHFASAKGNAEMKADFPPDGLQRPDQQHRRPSSESWIRL